MNGHLIAFEGLEACGKSTQLTLLGDYFRNKQREVLSLREPGGTPLSEDIRDVLKHRDYGEGGLLPRTELLLFNAARAQLVEQTIKPALKKGAIVLLDRFYYSTIAYQGDGRQMNRSLVDSVINAAIDGTHPDAVIYLQTSVKESYDMRVARATLKGEALDRFEKEDPAFFTRVYRAFEVLARSDEKVLTVPFVKGDIEGMHQRIVTSLEAKLHL